MIIPRSQMPQISQDDLGKLIVYLGRRGARVIEASMDYPNNFSRHQDVDRDKVSRMPQELLDYPILVTRLNEVIDGNHRLALHEMRGGLVPFIRFDCSFVEALDLLTAFPFNKE